MESWWGSLGDFWGLSVYHRKPGWTTAAVEGAAGEMWTRLRILRGFGLGCGGPEQQGKRRGGAAESGNQRLWECGNQWDLHSGEECRGR